MNKSKTLLVTAALAAMTASTYAVSFNTVTGPFSGGISSLPGGAAVGHRFDVTGPGVFVTGLAFVSSSGGALGSAAADSSSIQSTRSVRATAMVASPITSATITSANPVSGNYAWQTLGAPVYLAPGSYGLLVSSVTLAGGDSVGTTFLGDGLPTFTSGAGVVATSALGDAVGGPLSAPSIDLRRFKVANFEFTPVPEPETYAMIAGLGLVGFGLWRKRQ